LINWHAWSTDTLGDSWHAWWFLCEKSRSGICIAKCDNRLIASLPQVLPPRCCLRRVPCGNVGSYIAGSPNFFVRGPHELLHNSSRAEHLTWWDCFGICYILPSQQVIRKYIFFHYQQNNFGCRIWPTGRSLETPVILNSFKFKQALRFVFANIGSLITFCL